MFPRKIIKQNKFKRILLKLLNVYAFEKETLNIVNPDYKNQHRNFAKFNDKSFNFSQGYLNLTRKINKLDIYFRYTPNVNLWNSSKEWKRIVPNIDKADLIYTSLISLMESVNFFKKNNSLDINLHLIPDNSYQKFDENLLKITKDYNITVSIHKTKITGNRGSYLECCDQAEKADDLIFFIEDDYLFEKNSIEEILISYSRISTILNTDIIMCPSDYSFFYDSLYKTSLLVGKNYKWRIVNESLLTFIFSKSIFNNYKDTIRLVGEKENNPFEKPLHELYKKEICIAPINSLCYHISRGVPALTENWEDLWNENYKKYLNYKANLQ